MSLAETLSLVVANLDRAGIAHMISGSIASTHHGEPRSTRDIDIVIVAEIDQVGAFIDCFDPSRYYFGDPIVDGVLRDQFNIIDTVTGWKIDLMARRDRPFSRTEFDRREPINLFGVSTSIATGEDTILAKLEWRKESGSHRQLDDVVAIISVRKDLDLGYLHHWAEALGLTDDLNLALEISSGKTGLN